MVQVKEGLKAQMKRTVFEHPEWEEGLLKHSKQLFRLNNLIIRECENPNIQVVKYVGLMAACFASFYLFAKYT